MIAKAGIIKPLKKLEPLQQENNELIALLFQSIDTTEENALKRPEDR
jgi:hypothetical protein